MSKVKVTIHLNDGSEKQNYDANGYDVLSCGLLAIRVEQTALKSSLIASVSKEKTINIPLSSISWFEVEE